MPTLRLLKGWPASPVQAVRHGLTEMTEGPELQLLSVQTVKRSTVFLGATRLSVSVQGLHAAPRRWGAAGCLHCQPCCAGVLQLLLAGCLAWTAWHLSWQAAEARQVHL